MKQSPVGIGLIGLGRQGLRYARHLLADVPGVRLIAVCRKNPNQGFPLPVPYPVTVIEQVTDLVQHPSVDVVVSAAPPQLSPLICRAAVAAGKPLLVEKPLATTESDGAEMVRIADKAGIPLMVAQTLRFNRALDTFRSRLAECEAIDSLTMTLTVPARPRPRDNPGFGGRGVLLDLGIHLLDLARYLTDSAPRVEACIVDRLPPAGFDTRADIRLSTIDGISINLLVAWSQSERIGTVSASGSRDVLSADWVNHGLIHRRGEQASVAWQEPERPTITSVLSAFVQAVVHNRPMPIPGQDGLEALRLVESCYRIAQVQFRHATES
ncbi:MAG: Gfo/Idh/MocA family oxidoreductase [Nitrospiraceae bacterium]